MKVEEIISLNEANPLTRGWDLVKRKTGDAVDFVKRKTGDAVDTAGGKATHAEKALKPFQDKIEKALLDKLNEINASTTKAPSIATEAERIEIAKQAIGARVEIPGKGWVDLGSPEHTVRTSIEISPAKAARYKPNPAGGAPIEIVPARPAVNKPVVVRWDSLPEDNEARIAVQKQIDALPAWATDPSQANQLKSITDDAYKNAQKAYDAERMAINDAKQKQRNEEWEKRNADLLKWLRRSLTVWNVEETFISPLETLRSNLERAKDLAPDTVWSKETGFKKVSPEAYQQWYNEIEKKESQVCAAQIATNIIVVFGVKGASAAVVEKFSSLMKILLRLSGKTPANIKEVLASQAATAAFLTALNTTQFSNYAGSVITQYLSNFVVGNETAAYLATMDGIAGTILKVAGVWSPSQLGIKAIDIAKDVMKKPATTTAPAQQPNATTAPAQQPNNAPATTDTTNTQSGSRADRLSGFN